MTRIGKLIECAARVAFAAFAAAVILSEIYSSPGPRGRP